MTKLAEKLSKIQRELNAPKSQFNSFGKYSYRNCEDIMTALKPFLDDVYVTVSDEMQVVGDRVYVKATATISDGEVEIRNTAYAREASSKKGMDDSQLTGATSSYARKYALSGLFLVDDNKDADSMKSSESGGVNASESNEFEFGSNAKAWVAAIEAGTHKLENIEDINYRNFIKSKVKK